MREDPRGHLDDSKVPFCDHELTEKDMLNIDNSAPKRKLRYKHKFDPRESSMSDFTSADLTGEEDELGYEDLLLKKLKDKGLKRNSQKKEL